MRSVRCLITPLEQPTISNPAPRTPSNTCTHKKCNASDQPLSWLHPKPLPPSPPPTWALSYPPKSPPNHKATTTKFSPTSWLNASSTVRTISSSVWVMPLTKPNSKTPISWSLPYIKTFYLKSISPTAYMCASRTTSKSLISSLLERGTTRRLLRGSWGVGFGGSWWIRSLHRWTLCGPSWGLTTLSSPRRRESRRILISTLYSPQVTTSHWLTTAKSSFSPKSSNKPTTNTRKSSGALTSPSGSHTTSTTQSTNKNSLYNPATTSSKSASNP